MGTVSCGLKANRRERRPSLECGGPAPLWSELASRRFRSGFLDSVSSCLNKAKNLNLRDDQSGAGPPHSKEMRFHSDLLNNPSATQGHTQRPDVSTTVKSPQANRVFTG
jgi:hypothetical protein